MKKPKYKVPFSRGDMMSYTSAEQDFVQTKYSYLPTEWREVTIFEAVLKLAGWHKGRSSLRVGVVNINNGETYSMGMDAFYEAVARFGVKDKLITGKWTYRKQGSNYSLYPVL